jgi:hypothetical protein
MAQVVVIPVQQDQIRHNGESGEGTMTGQPERGDDPELVDLVGTRVADAV